MFGSFVDQNISSAGRVDPVDLIYELVHRPVAVQNEIIYINVMHDDYLIWSAKVPVQEFKRIIKINRITMPFSYL